MLYSSCLCKWSIFTMLLDESYHSPFLEDDSTSNLNNVEHFVCTRIISYHSPFFQYGSSCKKKKVVLGILFFLSFSLFFFSFSLSFFFFSFLFIFFLHIFFLFFFLFYFFSEHSFSSIFFSFQQIQEKK